jgi:hypothetical protein
MVMVRVRVRVRVGVRRGVCQRIQLLSKLKGAQNALIHTEKSVQLNVTLFPRGLAVGHIRISGERAQIHIVSQIRGRVGVRNKSHVGVVAARGGGGKRERNVCSAIEHFLTEKFKRTNQWVKQNV